MDHLAWQKIVYESADEELLAGFFFLAFSAANRCLKTSRIFI
jgi:hypothetical protein